MVLYAKNYLIALFFLVLCFGCPDITVEAQGTDIEFLKITGEEAISNGSIVCIFQDREGFMWFGTYGGLYKYDGNTYREFQSSRNNPNTLVSTHIRSICQDTAGAIYIGTMGGLNVYYPETDQFKRFIHDPNDPQSLAYNTIYKIFIDKSRTIWVGTWGGGLDRIERVTVDEKSHITDDNFRFVHHLPDERDNSIPSVNIADITETPDGTLWIATQNGLSSYHKKTNSFYNYSHNPKDPNSISNNNVSALCVDNKGNLWAGTWEYGLNLFVPADNKFIRFLHNPHNKNSLSHNIIMRLYCDLSGSIWVGTWGGGLNKIEVQERTDNKTPKALESNNYRFIHYKNDKNNPMSISGNSIYSILEDRSGTHWVGTDWNGLNKFNLRRSRFSQVKSVSGEPNSLIDNVVFTLLLDKNNLLWIGTQNGINTYDRKTGKFKLYQNDPANPNSLSYNEVRSIIEDKNGNIWVGTIQGLNKFDRMNNRFERYYIDPDRPGYTHILYVYEDKQGFIWLGTYEQGLMRFDPKTKAFKQYIHNPDDPMSISSNIIWSIVEDQNNKIWLGAEQGGLCKFDPITEKSVTYKNITNAYNRIYALKTDSLNNLWVGSLGGLSRVSLDKKDEKFFSNFTTDLVYGITEDIHHQLWLTTDSGLGLFNPVDTTLIYYKKDESKERQIYSINAILYDRYNNNVYAGGLNGYYIFNPEISEEISSPPVTKIVNLKIFNKTINVGEEVNGRIILPKSIYSMQKLSFSHKEYVISIEYTALYYQSPEDNKYAYMLEGFDRDWNYVGNQQIATYTNLPPDNYIFKVKAANPNEIWNDEPTTIELVIKPAWWNTILFKILLLLALVSVIVSVFLIRLRMMKRRQRVLENTVSNRTQELSEVNTLLEEKQEEVTLQNEELVRHRNDLESLVADRTKELTIAKEKAEESDRLKSAFLANMSHEIRTPMNAIVGFTSLLDDETLNLKEKKTYINTIINNSDTLMTIINNILDISMIEANQLVLFKEHFCVDELLTELKGLYDLKNEKGLKIEYCIDNDRPKTYLYNDHVRLRQVLIHLLDNAYKFTSKGSVKFGYETEEKLIRFFIKDTGIGISDENKASIFEDFHKIEPYSNKFHRGTGMGLSISKRLVNLMGGDISLNSESGKGSAFYFTLPYTNGAVDQPENTPELATFVDPESITILVAEDEPDNYLLIEKILKTTDISIVWARNGQEAVDKIKKHSNNNFLVLMDIKMPVMDGFEASRQIKQLNKKIPVIAVTAFTHPQGNESALKDNFDDVISKPLSSQKLHDLINRYVNLK